MVSTVGDTGNRVRSWFKRDKKAKTTLSNETINLLRADQPLDPSHSSRLSIGVVFANEKARSNIYYNSPTYPVGSIIVREKHDDELKVLPNTVIAMVKRETGFSPATGDWEFFMLDGRTLALQLRETTGNCAACHTQAKSTDWSFRTYMNFVRRSE